MNLLLLLSMIRFNDTFLFTVGTACFINGFFLGGGLGYFVVFGLCFGTLIRHAIQDLKKKN
jgi:hypothetical protein